MFRYNACNFLTVIVIVLLSAISAAKAETIYVCEFKISKPLIGSDKVFWDNKGSWERCENAQVSSDRAILRCRQNTSSCDGGNKCDLKEVINLIPFEERGIQKVLVTRYAENNCKVKKYSSCKSYSPGDELDWSRCFYQTK